jgi:hypothetical protein
LEAFSILGDEKGPHTLVLLYTAVFHPGESLGTSPPVQ